MFVINILVGKAILLRFVFVIKLIEITKIQDINLLALKIFHFPSANKSQKRSRKFEEKIIVQDTVDHMLNN